jgi:soluble lytic murein transglycosylase-like protein
MRSKWTIASIVLWLTIAVTALALGVADVGAQAGAESWRPAVAEACAVHGCSADYLLSIIACESGGDPNAVSYAINPGTGMHDYGLLQISPIWGDVAYADGVTQIWWAASHLGSVYWTCG